MKPHQLTKKQEILLEFVERYLGENRLAPLIREIQTGCQIASYKSVIDRLNALERKGYIKRVPNKHRGIRLIKAALAQLRVQTVPESLGSDAPVS